MTLDLATLKTYPFEYFYDRMPREYQSFLIPEARTEITEFSTAADFLLFGYIWSKLPKDNQFWSDTHDKMHTIVNMP